MPQGSSRTPEVQGYIPRTGAIAALILTCMAATLFLHDAGAGLAVDDAYIHFVYARNIAGGQGFSFNQGEPSFGTTSPLWVFLLAVFIRWVDPVTLVRVINVICLLGSTLLVYLMAHSDLSGRATSLSSFERVLFPLAGAALFCFSGNLLWIYFCGMETPVFLLLGLLGIYLMRAEKPSPAGGAVLGLLVLTRVTGGLLVLILLIYRLVKFRRLKELYPFIISVLVYAPFGIYFLIRFQQVFPTTMGGKLAADMFNAGLSIKGMWRFVAWHIRYIALNDLSLFIVALLTIILGTIYIIGKRKTVAEGGISSSGIIAVWAVAHFFLHALAFRSTYIFTPYHNLRYQAIMFPAIAAAAALLFGTAADFFRSRGPGALVFRLAVGALIFMGILGTAIEAGSWHSQYMNNIVQLKTAHQAAALWTRDNLPEGSRLACFDIGSLKFYSDRYVIDLGGLIDPSIHPYLEEKRVGPYMAGNHATHYIDLVKHDSDRLTGVKKDDGGLYRLKEIRRFVARPYKQPVFLHSFGMVIYEIEYMEGDR